MSIWIGCAIQVLCTSVKSIDDPWITPSLEAFLETEFSKLREGQSIKCRDDSALGYRYIHGERVEYTTAEVARSWDPEYDQAPRIDCTFIPVGTTTTVDLSRRRLRS